MTGPEVVIEPVEVGGAGMLHRVGDEMLHVPDEIRARVNGLPWDVSFTVRLSGADEPSPEIGELRITQREGGVPIGSDVMRALRIGDARDQAVRQASSRWIKASGDRWLLDFAPVSRDRAAAASRRSLKRVSDDVIATAATAYIAAKQSGRRDFLMAVADACHVSRATADRYVKRAITAGLINEEGD